MCILTYPNLSDFELFVHDEYKINVNNLQNIAEKTLGYVFEQYDNRQPGQYGVFPANGNSLIGIDIPVMVKDGKPQKTIAIVSQDPLRNDKDSMLPNSGNSGNGGNVIVGTPFALHYKVDCYPQTAVYRDIIKMLLRKGYAVYLTDARKIYPKMKNSKQAEIDFLFNELGNQIKPEHIITFGSVAKDYLSNYSSSHVINLLHPSQSNWDHWKQWIFEQAYYGTPNYSSWANQISKRNGMFDTQNTEMPRIIKEIVETLIP